MYKYSGALMITLLMAVRLLAQDSHVSQAWSADSTYQQSFSRQRVSFPGNQPSDSTYQQLFSQQRIFFPGNQPPDTTYLQSFNLQRMHTTQTAMIVLGGWAVANIATGLVAMGQTSGEARYFHQMNAIWNVVNLGIATAGYLGSRKLNGVSWNMPGSIKEQNKIEKIYLVNGALDIAYILGGLYAREYGKNQSGKEQDRWKGYGSSIILQGGFLLLYDAVNLTIHHRHGKGLYQKFENVQVSFSPGSVVAGITF